MTSPDIDEDCETVLLDERFEIVSLGGTISLNGVHLCVSLADCKTDVQCSLLPKS